MKKRIVSAILCMAMVFPLFGGMQGAAVVNAVGIDENDYCADISGYRTGEKEDWTYPTKEGYVFAGWYTQNDFQQKYALTDTMVSGGAYAKFVDEDVFSVKFQMNKLANVADESMDLRMLTTVDDLTYQSVGFRFETGGVSQDFMSNTVYDSLLVDNASLVAGQTVLPTVFSEESNYIVGHSVNDIPNYHFSAQFTITPIMVTLDGTTVEGVSRSMNIMDDYTVMPDQTFTYNGGGTDRWWDTNVKIYPGQWVVFDNEGLTKDIAGQGVKLRCPATGEAYGDSNDGRKNTCIPDSDTIRYFIQFNKAVDGKQLACQLWANGAGLEGKEVTYSNIRILNEPEDAYFYKTDEAAANYIAPYWETLATSLGATAGRVLSYRVAMTNGSVKNASIYLNNGTTPLEADQVYTNAGGTQTVQFVLPEDAANFKPVFEIEGFTAGAANEITIEELKVIDALDIMNIEDTDGDGWLAFDKIPLEAGPGDELIFDFETDKNVEVFIEGYKGGTRVIHHTWLTKGSTHRGTQTISYALKAEVDEIQIYSNYPDGNHSQSISNVKIMGVRELKVDPTSGVPYEVYSTTWPTGHVQGIAVDDARQYMYYSFTTVLVKMDMSNGAVVGTVNIPSNLHLGDLEYYNGKLYGSLSGLSTDPDYQYVAVFNTDSITSRDMSYTTVMQAIYMKDLINDIQKDYYGMVGLDGLTFGTMPGDTSGEMYMIVAGIPEYIDESRTDKNYQVLYFFDLDDLGGHMQALDMNNPHKIGPEVYRKLFVYTGQHYSGPQTLTYDYDTKDIWLGMYADTAAGTPRYRLLAVEHDVAPVQQSLNLGNAPGVVYDTEATEGYVATLAEVGAKDTATGIWGFEAVPHDVACGFISLGNNYFYVGANGKSDSGQFCYSRLHYFNRETNTFTQVTP